MRSIILILTVAIAIAAIGLHWIIYHDQYGPQLANQARDFIRDSGVKEASVTVEYFDIILRGSAPDDDTRLRAETAIHEIPGLRLRPAGNQITIPQRLQRVVDEPDTLKIEGWLRQPASVATLQTLLRNLRPDLPLDLSGVHVSAHVEPDPTSPEPLTDDSPLIAPLISSLRVPVELSIHRDLQGFTLSGHLPTEELKSEILAALQQAAPKATIQHQQLAASPHVITASFAESSGLAEFVGSFFSNPSQSAFSISSAKGARLEGAATRDQESRWLTALRDLAGGLRVDVNLQLYPSPYHLPGYEPQSAIDRLEAQALRTLLAKRPITFAQNSSDLSPEEASVLASLTPELFRAGPGLRLLVASPPDAPESSLQLPGLIAFRLQNIIDYLVQMGLPPHQIRPIVLSVDSTESLLNDGHPAEFKNMIELLIE